MVYWLLCVRDMCWWLKDIGEGRGGEEGRDENRRGEKRNSEWTYPHMGLTVRKQLPQCSLRWKLILVNSLTLILVSVLRGVKLEGIMVGLRIRRPWFKSQVCFSLSNVSPDNLLYLLSLDGHMCRMTNVFPSELLWGLNQIWHIENMGKC